MAGACMVAAPVEKALPGVTLQAALSTDQGPLPWCHGELPGDCDVVGAYCQVHAPEQSIGEPKQHRFWCAFFFLYIKPNFIIFDSDIVILGLYLLIFWSKSVCHGITTVETGWVCPTKHTHPVSTVKLIDTFGATSEL